MNKADLFRDFLRTTESTAQNLHLSFGSDCLSLVEGFINTGIDRLEAESLLDDRRSIARAETNLVAFVGAMAHEARQQNSSELREFTFGAATSSLCPLWPFC
jgi:hypothetical protein